MPRVTLPNGTTIDCATATEAADVPPPALPRRLRVEERPRGFCPAGDLGAERLPDGRHRVVVVWDREVPRFGFEPRPRS